MRIFVLTGPTGVGKSEVAVALAERYGLEIISADSRQIYRYFDIGTAKPVQELRQRIPFHLIDFLEPDKSYSAADFARDARMTIKELIKAGRRFIVVGGSNFYLRALFKPLSNLPPAYPEIREQFLSLSSSQLYQRLKEIDPQRAAELHPNDRQRVMRALEVYRLTGKPFSQIAHQSCNDAIFSPVYAVLTMARERLYHRINERFEQMMAAGLLSEVHQLKKKGFGSNTPAAQSYGYAELFSYIEGKIGLDEAVKLAKKRTREFAKRQLIWLRSLKGAQWFEFTDTNDVVKRIEPLLLDLLDTDVNLKQ
ncbi:MAG: tRNA (adenosine(37)-N6)-dimethylallyltransferase MiaA [bacterium]